MTCFMFRMGTGLLTSFDATSLASLLRWTLLQRGSGFALAVHFRHADLAFSTEAR